MIELPSILNIFIDIAAWLVFHITGSFLVYIMPIKWFENDNFLYCVRKWEKDGNTWQTVFKVKSWKEYLPDGAALFKNGFKKKRILHRDCDYYKMFIAESRRAELTHWVVMLPAPLFFIWNPFNVGIIMIIYAIAINAPCIIAQRYNRPRFQKLLKRCEH